MFVVGPVAHMARQGNVKAANLEELLALTRVAQAFRLAHAVQRFSWYRHALSRRHPRAGMCRNLTAHFRSRNGSFGTRLKRNPRNHSIGHQWFEDFPACGCEYPCGDTIVSGATTDGTRLRGAARSDVLLALPAGDDDSKVITSNVGRLTEANAPAY